MTETPETYNEEKQRKARRKEILCLQCSTSTTQVFHSWKKAAGSEYKPVEQSE